MKLLANRGIIYALGSQRGLISDLGWTIASWFEKHLRKTITVGSALITEWALKQFQCVYAFYLAQDWSDKIKQKKKKQPFFKLWRESSKPVKAGKWSFKMLKQRVCERASVFHTETASRCDTTNLLGSRISHLGVNWSPFRPRANRSFRVGTWAPCKSKFHLC